MPSTTEPVPTNAVFGDPHLHAEGEILALRYDADGQLWSVEEPGVLRQWDTARGEARTSFSLSDLETLWCFGPHARLLASASDDLSIWDPRTGDLLVAMPQESWVTALAFHSLQAILATGHDDGKVRLWDVNKQKVLHELANHQQPISALAFTADGKRLAVASEDKLISLWQTGDGKYLGVLEGHKDRIPALAWHPDGKTLVSAGWDTTARVWNVQTLEPVILLNYHDTQVFALAFSPDGTLLATADSGRQIPIWDFAAKKIVHVLKEGATDYRRLAFSPDGRQLASGGERIIRLWDPVRGKPLSEAATACTARVAIALSPDGTRLVSQAATGLQLWDTATRKVLRSLAEEKPVHVAAFSPDHRWIAGGTDSHVRLWDAASGQPAGLLEGPRDPITALSFAPDGKILACGGANGQLVWLFRAEDGEPVLLIPDPLDGCTVEALAFHPQGRLLGVAGIDPIANEESTGAVALWDIVERCEVATFPGGARALAFSPSGNQVAVATLDQTVCIWDVSSRKLVTEIGPHQEPVHALAFSPDGKLLASGGDDWKLRFWETANWTEKSVRDLDCQVKQLVFAPDGKAIYAAGGNGICYRLDLTNKG